MKFVDISTTLYHLFHREQPPAPQPQPQTIYTLQSVTICPLHGEPVQEIAPGKWQCPKPHAPRLPALPPGTLARAWHRTHLVQEPSTYEPPSPHTGPISNAPSWINSEPSALDQLSQLVETKVNLEAVKERHEKHEGRGKAS